MEPVFERETFEINEDIKLIADVAYYQGHPICKTKTIELHYKDKVFTMEGRSSFSDRLIKDSLKPIYVIELVNYISRIVNGFNLFEVYDDNIDDEKDNELEAYTFGDVKDMILLGAQQNTKSDDFNAILSKRYNECYDSERREFNKKELIRHINPRFKYVNTNFVFDYVPIYGYGNTYVEMKRMSLEESRFRDKRDPRLKRYE